MKKLRILLVLCAIIFAAVGVTASFAAMDASATLTGPDTIREGDQSFTVEFKATAAELYGMTAKLTEEGPITRQNIQIGTDMESWIIEDVSAAGIFMMYGDTALTNCQNKVLFTITYQLNETAKAGDAVSIKFENTELSDASDTSAAFTCTYQKTIAKKLNTNTNLASLKIDGTALSGFDPAKTEYRLTLPYTTSSLAVTAGCAGEGATYTVTGNTELKFGENNVVITVTAESGATKNYTIKVTRQDPPDAAYLTNLSAGSSYPLSPEFDPLVTEYTVSVPYTKSSITFTHEQYEGSSVKIEGGETLAVGDNTVTITVTDQYKHSRVYTVTVTRRQNNNANLLKLTIDGHELTPAFNYTTTKYSLSVNSSVASLTVKATAAGDGASVSINDSPSVKLSTSGVVKMDANSVTIVVTVTAMDETTTKDYTVVVTREGTTPPDDPIIPPVGGDDDPIIPPTANSATLSSLIVTGYDLTPGFEADITQYSLAVPNGITSLDITALGIDGSEIIISGDKNFKVGENTVKITVKQSGKDDGEYIIKVTRAAAQTSVDSAKLQAITLSKGELSPAFKPEVLTYVVYLPYETTKISIGTLAGEGVTVTGAKTYTLVPGENIIQIISKSVEGTATYTIYAYVMPAFNGKLPSIDNNSGNNGGGTCEKTDLTIMGGSNVGDKLTIVYTSSLSTDAKYVYEIYYMAEDGTLSETPIRTFNDAKEAVYLLETKDAGKNLAIQVKDANGTILSSGSFSVNSTGSLNNKKTGIDVIGMVLSLVAALATLVIGFILGKMFGKRH